MLLPSIIIISIRKQRKRKYISARTVNNDITIVNY